ncbi:cytochrome P450 2C31-like [Liasis olivaceus]
MRCCKCQQMRQFYEVFPYIMKHLPGPHQAALSAVEMMILFAKKQIKQHMENQNLHEPEDFIDFYLFQMEKSKDDPNSTYDEDNLAQCIVDFFVGGTETTLTYLQWALLLMATHLDIQDKVYKEMEKVLGSSHSVCYEDWRKLPYTNAVIHEIMRNKYSLLFGLPRQCVQDIYLNGFLIPKGAVILPDLRSVLLDPEHWETPEEFNPNHFLDKEGNFVLKEAFLPFGAGARVCLGELLAKIEIFHMFTSLLRQFRFEPPEGVEKLSEESIIGIAVPPSPYKICALPQPYRYSYRTIIELILNFGGDALGTQFTAGGFYKDDSTLMESTLLTPAGNSGLRARHAAGSRKCDLLGPVHSDLFFQDKLLIKGVDVKVKLIRSRNEFCLMKDGNENYQVQLLWASLFVKHIPAEPLQPDYDHGLYEREYMQTVQVSGRGHQACLGDNLAKTEVFLFFGNLLQTFKFQLADGSKDVTLEPVWGGTLQPHYFEICAIPR